MCIRCGVLCFILLLNSCAAYAKPDIEIDKGQTKIAVDGDSHSILSATHTMEIKATDGQVELVLIPRFSYSSDNGSDVNLEKGYVRVPMGIWSIYGGEKAIAASFYYQRFGKGFFAGISKEKHDGSLGSGMNGARNITAGVVFPKVGGDHNTDITISYSNVIDDMAERRYQTWSLKSEKTLCNGNRVGCRISHNDRTLNGTSIANYNMLNFFYEFKFRKGFTGRFALGVTYEDRVMPIFSLKLNMDL